MKRFLLLFISVFILGYCVASAAPTPEAGTAASVTLRQSFEWARGRSEDLRIRKETIRQSELRGRAALGGIYPDVSWEFTDTWQEPAGVKALERQGFAGFVEKEQVESKFSLKQPIFSGMREFSVWSGAKRESTRNTLRLERASRELFLRTAESFYNVLGYETDWQSADTALKLAEDRVKELRSFMRLGKARDSEVFTAQARAAALKAELERLQGRIASARQELSFLTGQDLSSQPLTDDIPNPPTVIPLEEALSKAQNRTDLRAQREEVELQRLRIRYEKGFFWPTADITGNYYTQRPTFMDDIDWDVVFSVKAPLFQGGAVKARVREAVSAREQSLLTLQEMERDVSFSIRRLHADLTAAVREVQSQEEATQAAQKSYDALIKEYRLGLVTNLDVLQALDFLQSQRSTHNATLINAKRLYLQLSVATESEKQ